MVVSRQSYLRKISKRRKVHRLATVQNKKARKAGGTSLELSVARDKQSGGTKEPAATVSLFTSAEKLTCRGMFQIYDGSQTHRRTLRYLLKDNHLFI